MEHKFRNEILPTDTSEVCVTNPVFETDTDTGPQSKDVYMGLDQTRTRNVYESIQKEDHTYQEDADTRIDRPRKKLSLLLVITFLVIILGAITAGVVVYVEYFSGGTDATSATPATTAMSPDVTTATSAPTTLPSGVTTATPATTAMSPAWTAWTNWGSCDVTCDGGVRQRTRVCVGVIVPYESLCFPPVPLDFRDCDRVCSFGVLNVACDACVCDSSTLTGFVHDADNIPLSGVTVAYEDRPYVPLVVATDVTGTFSVDGVCATPTSILATKSLYGTVAVFSTVVNPTTSTVDITMTRMGVVTATPDPAATALPPAWTAWTNWGSCDVTCDGGVRQRTRVCTGPNDNVLENVLCAGQPQENEACSEWRCPDCDRVCSFGVLNVACDACVCDSSTLTGFVHDADNIPLSGVTVAYEDRPYVPLVVATDNTGTFSVDGVCATPTSILATKSLYGTVAVLSIVVNPTTSTVDITMTRMGVVTVTPDPAATSLPPGVTTTTPATTAMPPAWTAWTNWGSCDVTCDGGMRQRTRVCTEPNDNVLENVLCAGQPQENEACSEWLCPDCGRACVFGVLNTACDACVCDSSTLTGFVHDADNRPLSGVTIAYEDIPYISLVVATGNTGTFSVVGVCATQTMILATKSLYGTVSVLSQVVDAISSTVDITMTRMELPNIVDNPRNKVRAVGENVAFCCSATASPPITRYEWFKNGNILDTSSDVTDKLTLTQLDSEESGSYQCRVTNKAGSVFSTEASLLVAADASSAGCNPEPISNFIELPTDCVQQDTGKATYDIGTCPNTLCGSPGGDDTRCVDIEENCCAVVDTELVTVTCSDYEILRTRITECGCSECVVIPIRVAGRVVSAVDDSPLLLGSVFMHGELVSNTDFGGNFVVEITDSKVSRLALTFKDTFFNSLQETTKVVTVSSGSSLFITVKMKARPVPFQIQSDVENEIAIAGEEFAPVGVIVLLPNSFYDGNGNSYTGQVNVFLTNFDMRRESDRVTAPGEFTTVGASGDTMPIQSFGLLSLYFTGSDNQRLSVGGSVPIYIDSTEVPALEENEDENGLSEVKMWVLNKNSGFWEVESCLVRNTARRRKKRSHTETTDYFAGTLDLTFESVCNIDVIWDDVCFAKVVPYASDSFLNSEILGNVEFSILVEDNTNSNGQYFYGYYYPSYLVGGGVCITAACDPSTQSNPGKYDSYITAQIIQNYFEPATLMQTSANPTTQTNLNAMSYFIDVGIINKAIKITAKQNHITTTGPLYGTESECRNAAISLPYEHFKFYLPSCVKIDPVHNPLQPVQFPIHTISTGVYTRFAYYPFVDNNPLPPSNPIQACFIRLEVTAPDDIVRIKSSSYAFNTGLFPNDTPPIFYGSREVCAVKDVNTDMAVVCLEYKCPGIVFGPQQPDPETVVEIEVMDLNNNLLTCDVCSPSGPFLSTLMSSTINPFPGNALIQDCSNGVYSTSNTAIRIPDITFANAGLYKPLLNSINVCIHSTANCAMGGSNIALKITCP
ncbi:cartilage intermediate layer protein 1-like [Amphiura filiformis]|uniref:cartilage intermediate layer protein 1-like n=1 Tax=Amphiura filiformis TaxID=82378 RepID=UPI003B21D2AC